jgi:hypothetical protein
MRKKGKMVVLVAKRGFDSNDPEYMKGDSIPGHNQFVAHDKYHEKKRRPELPSSNVPSDSGGRNANPDPVEVNVFHSAPVGMGAFPSAHTERRLLVVDGIHGQYLDQNEDEAPPRDGQARGGDNQGRRHPPPHAPPVTMFLILIVITCGITILSVKSQARC